VRRHKTIPTSLAGRLARAWSSSLIHTASLARIRWRASAGVAYTRMFEPPFSCLAPKLSQRSILTANVRPSQSRRSWLWHRRPQQLGDYGKSATIHTCLLPIFFNRVFLHTFMNYLRSNAKMQVLSLQFAVPHRTIASFSDSTFGNQIFSQWPVALQPTVLPSSPLKVLFRLRETRKDHLILPYGIIFRGWQTISGRRSVNSPIAISFLTTNSRFSIFTVKGTTAGTAGRKKQLPVIGNTTEPAATD
jgi:hypothetical protein